MGPDLFFFGSLALAGSQRRVDSEGWRREAHTLLPSDNRVVPTIVMRWTGGVPRAGALGFNTLKRNDCSNQCYVEGSWNRQGLSCGRLAPAAPRV